jgi:hypothetical protein
MARLVCDDPGSIQPDYYTVLGLSAEPIRVEPDPDPQFGFSLDLNFLAPGNYTVRACACKDGWGCSIESVPFVFTKPNLDQPPQNLRLVF